MDSAQKCPRDTVDQSVGSRMKTRRLMMGMSQEKLAGALGLSFQQVQKYEKGVNRMGASRLQRVAEILDVPVQFFFDEMPTSPDPSNGDFLAEFVTTSEGIALARAFMRITERPMRAKILHLVEEVAEKYPEA